MPLLLTFYHLTQTLLAAYTGTLSYVSIRRVQTYEDMSQKAAKYSNVADHHLQTTRTTMAAGAVSVLASTTTSLILCFNPPTSSPLLPTLTSAILCVGITAAHTHISNYWRAKAKVPIPGSGDYNDAISSSNRMRTLLGVLAASWGVVAGWYCLGFVM